MNRRDAMFGLAGVVLTCGGVLATSRWWMPGNDQRDGPRPVQVNGGQAVDELHKRFRFEQAGDPARTIVLDGARRVAELTSGARTVLVAGPARTFTEPQATAARIETTWWVRVAPAAYHPEQLRTAGFAAWLLAQIGNTGDDVLAAATQYITGAPERTDANGVRYAGDAGFGYLNEESIRDGADFYDFLGVPWTWQDGQVSRPSTRWNRQLDCSGYVRLIYGYRMGIEMFRGNGYVTGLPRTAYAISDHAPSVVVASPTDSDEAPTDLSRVRPGDLVFFALHAADPGLITHCGIVLGPDTAGGLRFVSARQRINGPTFGDVGGDGVIDSGYFGKRLRRAIRL